MGLLELCLLPMLSPQEPAPPIQPEAAVAAPDPATWLPANVLAAITWRAAAVDAGIADLWQQAQSMDPVGITRHLQAGFTRELTAAGLEAGDLVDLLRGGGAIALLGFTAEHQPRFVAVAHAPERAQKLQAALDRLAATNGARSETIAGRPCLRLDLGELDCYGGVFGSHLVFATDAPTMAEVISKTQQETDSSLALAPEYAAACTSTDCGGAAQITVFLRPKQLFAVASSQVPAEMRPFLDRFGTALQLDGIDRAMLRIGMNGQLLRCAASFPLPSTNGFLAAVLGDPSRLTAKLAEAVPPKAREFSFSTLDLSAVVTAALSLAAEIDPDAGRAAEAQIDQISKQTGTNLRTDLIGGSSGQIVAVRFASGYGVSFGLRDGARFERSLAGVLKATGAPLEQVTIAGVAARRIDPRAGSPTPLCFATVGNWLCFADSDDNLAEIVRQHGSRVADPEAAAALQKAPTGTTMLQASRDGESRTTLARADGQIVLCSSTSLATLLDSLADGTPAASTAQQVAGADTNAPRASAAEVAALQKAEHDPTPTALAELDALAESSNAAVAARATWLLAAQKNAEAVTTLERLATASPHQQVRLQAMHGLFRARSITSVATAITGLDDADVRVRTVAAQLLGKLRRPAGKTPLLALLDRSPNAQASTAPATDVQAALLALCDMEATEQLLPAATAIAASGASGAGQALTFYFQSLSPKLTHEGEVTLLLAVLNHREPMLRRYAIGRIGELAEPSTAAALEGRLATENDELRPLVEVALRQVRKQNHVTAVTENATEAGAWSSLQARWERFPEDKRLLLLGFLAAGLVMFLVVVVVIARQRRALTAAVAAEATVALVEPSAEFTEELAAESEELAAAAEALTDQAGDGEVEPAAEFADTIEASEPLAEDEVVLHDTAERQG